MSPSPPSPLLADLFNKECTLCGRCLQACPLFAATQREELSPRAKLFTAQMLDREDGALAELARRPAEDLAALCLGCGRCSEVCPQGLAAPELAARIRSLHPGFSGWLWKTWMNSGDALWPAMSALSRFIPGLDPGKSTAQGKGGPRSLARAMSGRAARPVVPWLRPLGVSPANACADTRKAVLFAGCTARRIRPNWVKAAQWFLDGLGLAGPVREPKWECCGATLGHAGLRKQELEAHRRNLALWRELDRPLLVVICASCGHGLRAVAQDKDLDWAPGEADLWAASVIWLASLVGEVRAEVLENAPAKVRYHRPCHAGASDPDQALLARLLGVRFAPGSGEACCGLGGVLQLAAPGLSRAVAADLWGKLGAEPGDQVLTGCSGCALQLAATAPKDVAVGHWLEIFDLAPQARLAFAP